MSENDDDDSRERINIMILGNSEVGKTCFIIKYTENIFQEVYLSTIGIDFKVKNVVIEEKPCKLFFYDTTGQEKYKSIALNVIKTAQGIILMYDITNQESFEAIPEWINSIQEVKGDNFPMILCGNKTDLKDKRKISLNEGEELAEEYNIEFFETSNKDGHNVNEAAVNIAKRILDRRKTDTSENNSSHNSTQLSRSSTQQNISIRCCKD